MCKLMCVHARVRVRVHGPTLLYEVIGKFFRTTRRQADTSFRDCVRAASRGSSAFNRQPISISSDGMTAAGQCNGFKCYRIRSGEHFSNQLTMPTTQQIVQANHGQRTAEAKFMQRHNTHPSGSWQTSER